MEPNPDKATISVCLCTFNRADLLSNALKSIAEQSVESFTFELVVTDDGSTDHTPDVIAEFRRTSPVPLRYVKQVNQGVAAARNQCVAVAGGDWIAFFDDDQIASPQWLRELYRVARETSAECIGGPSLLLLPDASGAAPRSTVRRLLGENPFFSKRPSLLGKLDPRRRSEFVPGTGNVLVKREVFARIGGFDRDVPYGEDADFFRRARLSGARTVAAPEAIMYQVVPEERLRSSYLLPLAERGARSRAQLDGRELSLRSTVITTLMRLGHLSFFVLPSLVLASVSGRQDLELARRCSLCYSLVYLQQLWLQRLSGGERNHEVASNR